MNARSNRMELLNAAKAMLLPKPTFGPCKFCGHPTTSSFQGWPDSPLDTERLGPVCDGCDEMTNTMRIKPETCPCI